MDKQKLLSYGKMLSAAASLANPVVGTFGAIYFEALSLYSSSKAEKFILDLDERLRLVEHSKPWKLSDVFEQENFYSLLQTGGQAAMHTQRDEKVERIKNAIINTVEFINDCEKIDSFFHLIDQLTEEHFVILSFISENIGKVQNIDNMQKLYEAFVGNNLDISIDVFGYCLYDLKNKRIIRIAEDFSDDAGIRPRLRISQANSVQKPYIKVSEVGKELCEITKPV